MNEAARAQLMQGERDSASIVSWAISVCGSTLEKYMTETLRRPSGEVKAYIQALAERELNRIPGITRSSPAGNSGKQSAKQPKGDGRLSEEDLESPAFLDKLDAYIKQQNATAAALRRLAESGDQVGMASWCAITTHERYGFLLHPEDGIDYCRWLAEQNVPITMFLYARAYMMGRGIGKDGTEAVRWFRKAAAKGHPSSMLNLGVMYADGRGGLAKDDEQAAFWYRKAAANGDPEIQKLAKENLRGLEPSKPPSPTQGATSATDTSSSRRKARPNSPGDDPSRTPDRRLLQCLMPKAKAGRYSSYDGGESARTLLEKECPDETLAWIESCTAAGDAKDICIVKVAIIAQATLKQLNK